MVPAAGTCSRANPLPPPAPVDPTASAFSTTLRNAAPSNEGTGTRSPAFTTTAPFSFTWTGTVVGKLQAWPQV